VALQLASTTTGNAISVNEHSRRIEKLEGEVGIIKKVIKSKNS
jgi:hypothetical protein